MFDDAYPSVRSPRRAPRRRRLRVDLLAMTAAAALVVGALPRSSDTPVTAPEPAAQASAGPAAPPEPSRYAWMFDPRPALGTRARPMRQVAAVDAMLEPAPAVPAPAQQAAAEPARTMRAPALQQSARLAQAEPSPSNPAQTVPLPVRRPAALQTARLAMARPAERQPSAQARAAAQENAEAERSFFDTVFGAKPSPEGPALAYAGVDEGGLGLSPRRPSSPPSAKAGLGTAVYDISARRVYLPSGEVLEAHSGLGPSMDDPRYVHLKMRGATPPGTYDLTEREALFHGVRALRLNPVGGASAIYNRVGLLTHTYMLGPNGASNGCISFKNYNRFLQAYLSGEVRRVVVVAGARQDAFPAFAERMLGR